MGDDKKRFGLLIDYDFCTGCHACEVACAQEFKRKAKREKGIRVLEIEQRLTEDKAYLTYLPFPTERCVLCKHLTKKGENPACVKACLAACMTYGPIDELAQKLAQKPKMALWTPC
ncbi:MAG: oxidoreductase [Myxococcota bacterium]|nr:oxidoreductase [Myxococcota bacterium]